jgi:excisionase family DNA binding protein
MTLAQSEICETTNDNEAMLSPKQVAQRLGCSLDHALDLIHTRRLPAMNISKDVKSLRPRFRVKVEDLQRFIESRMVRPPAKKLPRRRSPYERHV